MQQQPVIRWCRTQHLLMLCIVQDYPLNGCHGRHHGHRYHQFHFRSSGNVVFRAARLDDYRAALGVYLFRTHGFETLLYVAVALGRWNIFVSRVYVPFRAPIGMKVCSMDRFLLPRGLIPAFNLILIAFIPGLMLPVLTGAPSDVAVGGENSTFLLWSDADFSYQY